MNVLCAQLSIPHLPLMNINIVALRPTDTAAIHFIGALNTAEVCGIELVWGNAQQSNVLSSAPLQGLLSPFLSLLGRELFVHRRQSI